MRERVTSAAKLLPVSNFGFCGWQSFGAHSELCVCNVITIDAQDFANGCCSRTTSAVDVDSTARLKRYHEARGIFRARCGPMSPRSRTTIPNPPALMIMSAAFNALSTGVSFGCGAAHFTHSNLLRFTPFAAAERGSNALPASTRAQHSPCSVTSLIKERSRVVRPEEAGPEISVREPRGIAINLRSSAAIPKEIVSGSVASLTVRAQGMRLARVDSICALRADASGFTTTPVIRLAL